MKPPIVTLCGSTRFADDFKWANLQLTLAGVIVLSIGANMNDDEVFKSMHETHKNIVKMKLDLLHLCKIEMSDAIYVVGDGYIGESTTREIEYAFMIGKDVYKQITITPVDLASRLGA